MFASEVMFFVLPSYMPIPVFNLKDCFGHKMAKNGKILTESERLFRETLENFSLCV